MVAIAPAIASGFQTKKKGGKDGVMPTVSIPFIRKTKQFQYLHQCLYLLTSWPCSHIAARMLETAGFIWVHFFYKHV
jgi:hypothetical protein